MTQEEIITKATETIKTLDIDSRYRYFEVPVALPQDLLNTPKIPSVTFKRVDSLDDKTGKLRSEWVFHSIR